MNLKKAIEIKARTGEEFLNTDPDDIDEADRLVIEAGKAIICGREGLRTEFHTLLLGETKE